jgi:opacity protein-like surface antigen
MKRIMAVMMAVICLLGITSVVANAGFFDVVPLYVSAGLAYGWDMKGYGQINLGNEKNKPFGYDLKAGIDLLPYFAVEQEYLELKGFKGSTTIINPSYLFIVDGVTDLKIMVSNLKLKYPFKMKNVKISPFFTLGAGYADMTFRENYELKSSDPRYNNLTGSSGSVSRYPCAKTGGGVDIETKHFRISLEYSYLDIRNTESTLTQKSGYTANVVMAGVGYKF